jgi:hypothetical protein
LHVDIHDATDDIGADGERADGAVAYGVAVGRGARRHFHADHEGAAGTIVDHNLLLQLRREFRGEQTCNGVGCAARRLWHDHPDRPQRVIGRCCRACKQRASYGNENAT